MTFEPYTPVRPLNLPSLQELFLQQTDLFFLADSAEILQRVNEQLNVCEVMVVQYWGDYQLYRCQYLFIHRSQQTQIVFHSPVLCVETLITPPHIHQLLM